MMFSDTSRDGSSANAPRNDTPMPIVTHRATTGRRDKINTRNTRIMPITAEEVMVPMRLL